MLYCCVDVSAWQGVCIISLEWDVVNVILTEMVRLLQQAGEHFVRFLVLITVPMTIFFWNVTPHISVLYKPVVYIFGTKE
jgi:hypothetical protein